MRITWPVQRSWAFIIMASMLTRTALSRTSRSVTLSCHLMPTSDLSDLAWKRSGCFQEVFPVHGRRSVGDGGDASPHFSGWGDSIGIVPPPHFLVQKNCEAYSLTQHASLLKVAT